MVKLKILIPVALVVIAACVFCCVAMAHETVGQRTISATLHVDPADTPQVGKPSHLFFALKDSAKKFEVSKCNCQVSISKDDKELFSMHAEARFLNSSSIDFDYVFPEAGVYTASVAGTPLSAGAFDSFDFSYTVQVGGSVAPDPASHHMAGAYIKHHLFHIVIFGVGMLIAIFFIFCDKKIK